VQESSDSRLKLSFAQANLLCRELVPIGDEAFNYMTGLVEAGFGAFLPWHKFVESFAETPEELELHRRCIVENAKERLGQPTPIRIYDEDFKQLYFSPFLQQLREQRDQFNDCPARELYNRFKGSESWRQEFDPCQRRLVQDGVNRKEAHKARFTAMLEAQRQALKDEAENCTSGLGKSHTFDNKGRYFFFRAVMERDAAALGFRYDNARSRPNYPIFSKPMTDDWQLCWAIENARSFVPNQFEGRFEPCLELRNRQLTGSLAKAVSGEFLLFRYPAVVPGLYSGYREFFDLDQLERQIKAHLYLYNLMAPAFERRINGALIKLSL
jgi:hypothetical protein